MSGSGGAGATRRPAGGTGSAGWDPYGGASTGQRPGRGEDAAVTVAIKLEDAHAGASVPVRMPNGKTLSVKIPDHVEEGQQVRLKGQGLPRHRRSVEARQATACW